MAEAGRAHRQEAEAVVEAEAAGRNWELMVAEAAPVLPAWRRRTAASAAPVVCGWAGAAARLQCAIAAAWIAREAPGEQQDGSCPVPPDAITTAAQHTAHGVTVSCHRQTHLPGKAPASGTSRAGESREVLKITTARPPNSQPRKETQTITMNDNRKQSFSGKYANRRESKCLGSPETHTWKLRRMASPADFTVRWAKLSHLYKPTI